MKLSILNQIRTAFKATNRLAAIAGFIKGGSVPLAVYELGHHAVGLQPQAWQNATLGAITVGGLVYSAVTVFQWAMSYETGCSRKVQIAKSLGYVAMLEGVMTFAPIPWLSIGMLALIIAINGIYSACQLVIETSTIKASNRKPATKAPAKRAGNVLSMYA